MNEEIEYAEMLEIPVSTVNVVRKSRRRKKQQESAQPAVDLKDSTLATVNDRLSMPEEPTNESLPDSPPLEEPMEGGLHFDPIPERIDTVRLYDTGGAGNTLRARNYALNEGGRYALNEKSRGARIALGVEFGVACALCCGIFLTNVFMPSSAINTFFRALATPAEPVTTPRPYTDFTLTPVVSELSDAKLELSPTGILSFTDECCVYPAADGKVSEVTLDGSGLYTVKISHSDTFTGVITGLDVVYYEVGDSVKSHVPVGYSEGETEVQFTMYSGGQLLNCFQLTEENCLAWVSSPAS